MVNEISGKSQTRQQRRAQKAYGCVHGVTDKQKDYAQLAKRFPALVQACGLAQAVSFVQAKEKEIGGKYLEHLSKVIETENDLAKASRESDLIKYQRLSREAIEAATWLKRYADALLETES